MQGSEIKKLILSNNVKLWEIGRRAFNISDGNFSRRLRGEFNDEDVAKIISAIEEIKKEKRKSLELFHTPNTK